MYSQQFNASQDAIELGVWKLEAIADVLSALSNLDGDVLQKESFYGIALLMSQELGGIKQSVESIAKIVNNS
jgi:hypothetical protein